MHWYFTKTNRENILQQKTSPDILKPDQTMWKTEDQGHGAEHLQLHMNNDTSCIWLRSCRCYLQMCCGTYCSQPAMGRLQPAIPYNINPCI